ASDGRPPFTFKLGEKGALLLVCDGMGGAAAGEVAAQMAADAIYEALTVAEAQPRDGFARLLRRAVQRANERIFIQSRDNQSERGMGTTCTVAGLVDDTLVVAQIGDSRCYVLRDGKLAQVTKDQSLAWQLIEAGAMTPDEAKAFEHANIILQALGVQEHVEVVLSQVQLRKGDVALLCSDGLHGPVSDEELLSVLVTEPDLQKAGEALIQKALDRDGPDNITVALARFDGEALKPAAPEDTISFMGYDPGNDPVPEPMGSTDDSGLGRETIEERLPTGLLGAEDDLPTKTEPADPAAIRATRRDLPPVAARGVPSLLALFLIGLVFAAAGGIFFMKCERDQSTRSDGRVTLP
ncbi:MAG TPA: protein phosphatase 2C domain-containing protein, partial [Polyangia bacterium]